MNAEEREQVVELLRCAVDNASTRPSSLPFVDACDAFGTLLPHVRTYANDAAMAVFVETSDYNPRRDYLEAALRVEEGTWP